MRFSFTAFRKVLLRIRRDILYVNEPTSRNRNGKSERRESIDASETLLVSSLGEEIPKTNKTRMLGLPSFDGGSRGNNNNNNKRKRKQ